MNALGFRSSVRAPHVGSLIAVMMLSIVVGAAHVHPPASGGLDRVRADGTADHGRISADCPACLLGHAPGLAASIVVRTAAPSGCVGRTPSDGVDAPVTGPERSLPPRGPPVTH